MDRKIVVSEIELIEAIHKDLMDYFAFTEASGSIRLLGATLIKGAIDRITKDTIWTAGASGAFECCGEKRIDSEWKAGPNV